MREGEYHKKLPSSLLVRGGTVRDRPLPIASDSAASFRTEAVRASDSRQKKLRPSDSLAVIPAASQGDQARQYLSRKRPEPVPKTEAKPGICLSHNGKSCAPEGIRTPNLLIRSQMLYPLSYGRWSPHHLLPPREPPNREPRRRQTRPCAEGQAYRHTGRRRKSEPPRRTCPAKPQHREATPWKPAVHPTVRRPITAQPHPVRGLTTKGPKARMPSARHRDTVVQTAAFGLVAGRHLCPLIPSGLPTPIRQRAPSGRSRKGWS